MSCTLVEMYATGVEFDLAVANMTRFLLAPLICDNYNYVSVMCLSMRKVFLGCLRGKYRIRYNLCKASFLIYRLGRAYRAQKRLSFNFLAGENLLEARFYS